MYSSAYHTLVLHTADIYHAHTTHCSSAYHTLVLHTADMSMSERDFPIKRTFNAAH